MKGKRVTISEVDCTVFENECDKVCFLLSGSGYTYDKPILYYATQILVEKNYDVIQINYSFDQELFKQSFDVISQTVYEVVNKVVVKVLKKKQYKKIEFIGKSLGTLPIVNHYMQQIFNIPVQFINMTPLLSLDDVFINLKQTDYKSLIIIGSSDPHFDDEKIKDLNNHKIIVIPNANHSLDVSENTMNSLDSLKRLITEVDLFI